MNKINLKQSIALLATIILINGCSHKQPTPSKSKKIGVATVVGSAGGVILGGLSGGMLGMLASGDNKGKGAGIGVIIGALLLGGAGYSAGQQLDN